MDPLELDFFCAFFQSRSRGWHFFLQQVSELADSVRNKSLKSWLNGEFFYHCSSRANNGKS